MARREALECQTPVGERFCKKKLLYMECSTWTFVKVIVLMKIKTRNRSSDAVVVCQCAV